MKNYLKQHKEISFLIGVLIVLGFVSYALISKQRQNSELINSGTTLQPSNFGGRVTCEVPIPRLGNDPAKQESSPQKLQDLKPESKSAETPNNQSGNSTN